MEECETHRLLQLVIALDHDVGLLPPARPSLSVLAKQPLEARLRRIVQRRLRDLRITVVRAGAARRLKHNTYWLKGEHKHNVLLLTGNAMIGMAKGMGLHKEPEIAAEIREVGPPEPDDDDPIEVTIDPDHPENTRIVYRMQRRRSDDWAGRASDVTSSR